MGGKLWQSYQSLEVNGDRVVPGATKDNMKQLPEFATPRPHASSPGPLTGEEDPRSAADGGSIVAPPSADSAIAYR